MDQNLGRIPPHNQDAEVAALGILLLNADKMHDTVDKISSQDFYNPAHQKIYEAMLNLYNQSKPIDLITASEELRAMDELDKIGGVTYLAGLTEDVVTTANLDYYLDLIKDKATLRDLIEVSSQTLDLCYKDEEEVATVLEYAEKSIFDISQDIHQTGLMPMKEIMVDSFAQMEKRALNPSSLTGITTGFTDLDRATSGLQPSDLVLVAARPSMGKTAFVVNIAVNAALKDAKVAIFSLEMSKNQLSQRMMSSTAHVDLQRVINSNLESEEWQKLLEAIRVLGECDIYIDDTAGISPMELKAKARRLKAQRGLDMIIIDYLQLMEDSSRRNENRTQEISAISRALKGVAMELDVPVVALSQLSRAPEARQDKRPILSDLRESGAIEQDADVVMFLYRDEYYNPDTELKNIGEVIIAKHRNGPTGTIELTFLPQYTKFVNKAYTD